MIKVISNFIDYVRIYLYGSYFNKKISKRRFLNNFKKVFKNNYSFKDFLILLDNIKCELSMDLDTYLRNDPAVQSIEEVIICYPGFFATLVYRVAHNLYSTGFKLISRIMMEIVHSDTGIDIHPAAVIGKAFFIDHGTGIVIGETTIIYDNVKIYHGVTLGTKSFTSTNLTNKKRHPTIMNNVTIFSNATILGGDTVIGENSVIGCNTIITSSILPNQVIKNKSNYDKK